MTSHAAVVALLCDHFHHLTITTHRIVVTTVAANTEEEVTAVRSGAKLGLDILQALAGNLHHLLELPDMFITLVRAALALLSHRRLLQQQDVIALLHMCEQKLVAVAIGVIASSEVRR